MTLQEEVEIMNQIIRAVKAELLNIHLTGKPDFDWSESVNLARSRLKEISDFGPVEYIRWWHGVVYGGTGDKVLANSIIWKLLCKYYPEISFEDFRQWITLAIRRRKDYNQDERVHVPL